MPAEMLRVSIWSGDGFSTNPVTAPSVERAHEAVGRGVLDGREGQRRPGVAGVMERELRGHVEVREHVAVEHQEALVEQRLGELQRSARAQRLRLLDVAQADPVAAAVAEHVAHAGREEPARHDHVVDAVTAQPVEHEGDERPVDQRHDRLGDGRGQGPQARPLAAGEDQCLHRSARRRSGRRTAGRSPRRSARRRARPADR